MTLTLQSIQDERGELALPSRRLLVTVVEDLENLGDVRDWRAVFDCERGILTASACGTQGACTLISFDDELSLILARDSQDIDLGGILAREDVGLRIREIARSLMHGDQEASRVFEALPQIANHSVTRVSEPENWLLSSADTKLYLYFQTGPSTIQISRDVADGSPYTVMIQTGAEFPWQDITERVRQSPNTHAAVEQLLGKI
jgi:hypothetical protein